MRMRAVGVLFASFWFLQGCMKPAQVKIQTPQKQVLSMEPVVFVARQGKVIHIEQLTDEQLFDHAGQAYRAGQFAQARVFYDRLVQRFPQSDYLESGLYNLGLTLEKLNEFSAAVAVYSRLATRKLDEKTRRDTKFRLVAALLGAKQWPKAEQLLRELQGLSGLSVTDQIEVKARLGVALQEQSKHMEALDLFQQAIRLFHQASRKEYLGNDYFAAMAQYRIGSYFEQRFRIRKFREKMAEMREDLQFKSEDLLTAQAHYMRSIRIRHPHWVVASMYRIGDMYRQMFDDMISAPLPKLTAEEGHMYRCMLKKRLRILLTKAIYAFERNVQTAQVLGIQDSDWVQKTKLSLHQLRQKVIQEYYSETAISCRRLTEPAKTGAATPSPAPAKTHPNLSSHSISPQKSPL